MAFNKVINDQQETINVSYHYAGIYRVFTIGSKQKHGVEVGVYILHTETNGTVNWLRYHKIYGKNIVIATGNMNRHEEVQILARDT